SVRATWPDRRAVRAGEARPKPCPSLRWDERSDLIAHPVAGATAAHGFNRALRPSVSMCGSTAPLKRADIRKPQHHQSTSNQDDNVAGDTLLRLLGHGCIPPFPVLSALHRSGLCELLHSSGEILEVPPGAELRSLCARSAKM